MKNKMESLWLAGIFFLLSLLSDNASSQSRNSIYGSLGAFHTTEDFTICGWFDLICPPERVSTNLTINYERTIYSESAVTPFVKTGVGLISVDGDPRGFFTGQFGLLTGKDVHHFESSIGFIWAGRVQKYRTETIITEYPDYTSYEYITVPDGYKNVLFPIAISAGYRYQDPEQYFMLKTTVGYPEIFHLGMGVSF